MKQTQTITSVIKKFYELFQKIDRIDSYLSKPPRQGLRVTFHHAEDLSLLAIRWSDQYYGSEDSKKWVIQYDYEVKSTGISFVSYCKGTRENWWLIPTESWGMGNDEEHNTISLLRVPNIPPPNCKTSMYLFHQEKIREVLSVLPAWAIVCGNQ